MSAEAGSISPAARSCSNGVPSGSGVSLATGRPRSVISTVSARMVTGSDPGPTSREERFRLHLVYSGQMTSKDTTTVRVRRPDSERLSALAKSRQTTVVEVVHKALDALERQEFMRGLNVDYQSLDVTAREDLLAEKVEWDPLV